MLALSLFATAQTPSSNDAGQQPVKKIIVEEDDEQVPRTTRAKSKSQGHSSPAPGAQTPAAALPKQEGPSAVPQPDHIMQSAPAENKASSAPITRRSPDLWLHAYVILAALLTLIGLGASVIVSRQLLEMKKSRMQAQAMIQRAFELREAAEQTGRLIEQVIEQSNTAAEQARAANAAASAAKASSESFARTSGPSGQNFQLAQQAMQLEQRAWIFLSETHISDLQVGTPLKVTLIVRNTGRTLARNVQIAAQIEPLSTGQTPEPKLERTEYCGLIPPNGTLPINISRGCGPSQGLTEQCLQAIFSGDLVVWLYGTIHYEDVFETRQATMFCYKLQPDGKTFHAADIYNDAT